MSDPPQIGDELSLDHPSIDRRQFLRNLAVGGTGLAGVRALIAETYGAEPDGVPLVLTRDRFGEPDRVRIVSRERYRRLQVFTSLDVSELAESIPSLHGVRITQLSSEEHDLGLEVEVEDPWATTLSSYKGMPVTYRVAPPPEVTLESHRESKHYDTMKGNIHISNLVEDSDGTLKESNGTLGVVAYHDDENAPYKVLITAEHVIDPPDHDRYDDDIYQPEYTADDSRVVAKFMTSSPVSSTGMDVAKYNIDAVSGSSGEARTTVEADQPDVTGTWTYSGLSDQTSSGSVTATVAGIKTDSATLDCVDTRREHVLDYQADYDGHTTQSGDSGAPWVDADGKLVSFHSGSYQDCDTCERITFGPVGQEALWRINAVLYDPSVFQ